MKVSRRPLYLLEGANALSGLSNAIAIITVPWLIFERTGSATQAGIVVALSAIPGIFISPFVGALIDHYGRKRVSIGSDLLSALSVMLFPIWDSLFGLTFASIATFAILGAAFDPAGYTARKSLIPDVAKASNTSMDKLNSWHEAVFSGGWALGPAIGAFAISLVGAANSMWIVFAAFLLAIILIAMLHVGDLGLEHREEINDQEKFWTSTLRGLQVLKSDKAMYYLTLSIVFLAMVYLPTESVVLPKYFSDIDDPRGLGYVLSSMALGGIATTLAYPKLVKHFKKRSIVIGALAATSLAMIPMTFFPPIGLFVLAGFLLGLGWGPMNPLMNSMVQQRVAPHIQGRVFGVQTSLFYASGPIGMFVTGVSVDAFGVRPVYIAAVSILIVFQLFIMFLPDLHDLDREAQY
ncbi:MAG: MFS transporter [Candidatus Nanopelagicales bacterium]|nr:MFS transporter [Candidatus Nanopelagicales bacterium]